MIKPPKILPSRAAPAGRRKAVASPAKPSVAKKPAGPAGRQGAAPYHHGDLREALLKAAQTVLERDGLPGLTLRAVAREAGVSHAAPTHHFRDLTGLLSELAAIGFRDFNAAMTAAGATGTSPLDIALARGKAYFAYARARPGMYQLMFRTERLDMGHPALREAAGASFDGLANAIGAGPLSAGLGGPLTLPQAAQIARIWSLVHGFSMLALDDRLGDILRRLPEGTDAEMLFAEMLKLGPPKPLVEA